MSTARSLSRPLDCKTRPGGGAIADPNRRYHFSAISAVGFRAQPLFRNHVGEPRTLPWVGKSVERSRSSGGLPAARIIDRCRRAKVFSEPTDLNYNSCFKQNPDKSRPWFSSILEREVTERMGEPTTSKLLPLSEPAAGEPSCLIYLNGEEQRVRRGATISVLLAELKLAEDQVAVEVDRMIVRRPDWRSTEIHSGAAIEVVHFVGGG